MADGFEEDRVAGRTIVRAGMVILAVFIASLLLLAWLAHYYRISHPGTPDNWPVPAPPRIDPAPRSELESYLATQRSRLQGYRWVDREHGWVHIPIERAMTLYAQQAAKGGKR